MREVWQQILAMAIVLIFQAMTLLPLLVIAARRRRRFQFSLRTLLVWTFPLAAIAAWILSWDEPLFSTKRVVTYKAAALLLLVDLCAVVIGFRWLRAHVMRPPVDDKTSPPRPSADAAEAAPPPVQS